MSKKGLTRVAGNPYTAAAEEVLAPVAQLDRVTDFESVGCRFEPCRARSKTGIPFFLPLCVYSPQFAKIGAALIAGPKRTAKPSPNSKEA